MSLSASSNRVPREDKEIDYREAVEEWWLIILTFPILFAFIPGCTPTIARGFQALHLAPPWFQDAVGAAIVFAFGRRALRGLHLPSHFRGKRTTQAPLDDHEPPAQRPGT